MEPQLATTQRRALRKRKPEEPPENNERLSKRMSLLNLEQSGTKLYVPVESQQPPSSVPSLPVEPSSITSNGHILNGVHRPHTTGGASAGDDEMMQLDDSKYKVYIRNLDDELSSDSEGEEGKLIFLPDIEKHLRNNRIPQAVLAKPDSDTLSKQLVLYRVPSSISIPEEQDSVRKAIIEARARLREKHKAESRDQRLETIPEADMVDDVPLPNGTFLRSIPSPIMQAEDSDAMELD
ncbi:hypothetical protein OQA88_4183 [Cercophora sp. LCS_1]